MQNDPVDNAGKKPNTLIVEVLLETTFLTISFHPSAQILICDWTGFQTLESVQSGGKIILQILSEKNATCVLNDNTKVTHQWEDAVIWTKDHWFPAMTAAGLKHFAWIPSKDIFARISAKRAGDTYDFVRFFSSFYEAYSWLKQIH